VRHTLRLHGVIVGHSDLEHAEPSTGRAWGAFRPGLGYDLVQPVFRLFARAVPRDGSARDDATLARYYKARDALALELSDGAGTRIPTSAIHIADYSIEDGPQAIELDVLIADEGYWAKRRNGAGRAD
jgi:hypothetical protein